MTVAAAIMSIEELRPCTNGWAAHCCRRHRNRERHSHFSRPRQQRVGRGGRLDRRKRAHRTELDRDELVRLGAGIEGHPDNIAPALIGGCVIAAKTNESFQIAQVPIGPNLGIVLFIPELRMKTVDARRVVPETISRTDAVFNASRTALLTLALATERYDLLRLALEDRVHQHYREQLFPEMPKLFAAALGAGAFGAYLSGAGSTIGAFAAGNEQEIEAAFVEESRRLDVPGATLVTRPSQGGAQVEPGTDRG